MSSGLIARTRTRLRRLAGFDALLLSAAIWFLAKFLRYAFPPLFPTFGETFAASNAELGAAFTAMMTVYAAMQFPSGALADRVGAVRVVVAGAVVAAVGALVLVVPSPFAALVGAMLLVGFGTGAHKTVAVRLLSRTYPTHTGRALGVLDTFGALGGVAAPAAVVVALARADWHTLFAVAGAVGLALAVAFAVRAPRRVPPPAEDAGDDAGLRTYLGLLTDPLFAAFVGVTLAFSFAYNGVVAFLPLYLAERGGLSSATASLVYSGLFAVSLVQLVTGDLSDRVGRLPVIGVTLGLAAVGLTALVAVGTAPLAVLGAAVVAVGLGSHGFRPVRGAYLAAVIPETAAGGGLGVVRTLLMGAGAVAPAVVGVVSERAGFGVAFGLLAASMCLAVVGVGVVAVLDRR
ncbi:MFS transporter [Halobaculum sp. MBLA0143]|uniref:MFS transporter n=1 Tax=Halobaculum sp. MBLA0143 TaxID=3079933 RepID=UPI003524B88B